MSQPIISKPSDIAAMVMFGSLVLLIFWVLAKASKRTERSGDESTFGCDLMLGFVVLIVLGALAVALLTVFQGMYPGQ